MAVVEFGAGAERPPAPGLILKRMEGAELSALARVFGQSDEAVLAAMRADGVSVDRTGETLRDVARRNSRETRSLYRYFMPLAR